MKSLIDWISRHWAKIAIAIALLLLGASKVKRKTRQAKRAGDLYRDGVASDMSELSDANQAAKKRADVADQAAADAKDLFKGRVDEIANSSDDIGDILSDYRKRVRK